MGEIKSVKVDNWGVFFLQKLQNFFNKTDYCDLTLQFRDNSQLKVHRLVLSACTDYFNVLEQTCETIDDALIMPFELQADVVVPIVNFMYTGTLEFELKMYGKLLRTAKEMNMTVLLKLLEAHRRTMEGVSRSQRPPSPRGIRRRIQQNTTQNNSSRNQSPVPRRSVASNTAAPAVQQQATRTIQVGRSPTAVTGTPIRHQLGSGITILKTSSTSNRQAGGASTSTGASSSSSARERQEEGVKQEPASPFEQLRKGYSNNKRPPTTSIVSPPSKKPNLEDVKEFAEQQRMRKQIAAEYGDDQDGYDQIMEDAGIHNDDDDDEEAAGPSNQGASTSRQSQQQLQAAQATQAARQNDCNTIVSIRHEGPDRQPTIIVRENGNSKLNHTKIIQEVLRKYPHLVKGSKNIKLKILPSDKNTRPAVKKEETENPPAAVTANPPATVSSPKPSVSKPAVTISPIPKTTIKSETQSPVSTSALSNPPKILKQQTISPAAGISGALTTDSSGKKRIDSKTMYALIALGAENRTGPWLCLRCGVNNRPISIPSYRGFRRHLVNTHHEEIDPALCEHCGWRSQNDRNLHFHMQVEHKIKSNYFSFEECSLCSELLEDNNALSQHMTTNHPDEKQQCIYCNKVFTKEIELYTHMKTLHKSQAIDDGIIDASDDEYLASQDEDEEKKVQILSDITLPGENKFIKHVGAEEVAHTSGVNGNVTTTKFVTADGSEVILTDEQRKQIMSQLNQDVENGSVVMFLNDSTTNVEMTEMVNASENQDVVMEAASAHKEEVSVYDDSQIFEEMNNIPKDGENEKNESKGSLENLAWAEHFISTQENQEHQQDTEPEHMADEEDGADPEENENEKLLKQVEDQAKKQQDIDKKLKELAVDWTYDEEEEEENLEQNTKEAEQKQSNKSDNKTETTEEADEDDIDLALQNLHKEGTGLMEHAVAAEGDEDSQEGVIERLDDDIKTDDDEASQPDTVDADEKMDVDEENDIDNAIAIQNNAEFQKPDENSCEELGRIENPADEENLVKEDENDEDQVVEGNNELELASEGSAAQNDLMNELIEQTASTDSQDADNKGAIALGVITDNVAESAVETLGTLEPITTIKEDYKGQEKAEPMDDAASVVEEHVETVEAAAEIAPSTSAIDPEAHAEVEAESDQTNITAEDEKINPEDTSVAIESAKTPDAVKSLMSDWADDIDEDEDDDKNTSH